MTVYLVDHAAFRPPPVNNVSSFEMAAKGEQVWREQRGCDFLEKHPVVSVEKKCFRCVCARRLGPPSHSL